MQFRTNDCMYLVLEEVVVVVVDRNKLIDILLVAAKGDTKKAPLR